MTVDIVGQVSPRDDHRLLGYRRVRPDDMAEIVSLFERCSRDTLYHRFHGVTDGLAYARHVASSPDELTEGAWVGPHCVGIATLSRAGARAEVAVLVEDEWQRHGVGTHLFSRLLKRTRCVAISILDADILAEDAFLLRLLGRAGTIRSSLSWGMLNVEVKLSNLARPHHAS